MPNGEQGQPLNEITMETNGPRARPIRVVQVRDTGLSAAQRFATPCSWRHGRDRAGFPGRSPNTDAPARVPRYVLLLFQELVRVIG